MLVLRTSGSGHNETKQPGKVATYHAWPCMTHSIWVWLWRGPCFQATCLKHGVYVISAMHWVLVLTCSYMTCTLPPAGGILKWKRARTYQKCLNLVTLPHFSLGPRFSLCEGMKLILSMHCDSEVWRWDCCIAMYKTAYIYSVSVASNWNCSHFLYRS